ncbi:pre-mRNA 3'-end-processing factor FIP1 isoform X20 [Orcinus orca]|uniref:Pre-mRNA 3'-end-processing factor FIP1 n=2 Tax=Odontoceti TaxID=9722 RepID=A0A2Y9FC08_PHYMC|nr:pre-mRNA 3'-end-processing factor FIP1 isoform X19 [Physeter catodon]XP_019783736.1 pre-mRNA 3'-end-processing factor FIP1 isoform X19 [Tursiops truncatus]XP_033281322.1 pre-mRNA 3'-end-processing factor FIP1 isoform X20 [Orcinus orca]XP_059868527.1 pre-mRNA 3'-end-processing factor FIP1 isoform X19 [Delphinus delphis]XP_060004171.1 pre-mRNA 3'-end-processing factor FIP1 isoform X20 [Lagenorhynchus albirostris]XP_060155325.1 pre-mRNA 3'-end-processing factor FIP1 isoform X20 [Globicephala m|eukprot:XP_007119493.1 pre-mRNA 3'-end-processing factor FIP1 isoform X11 [Physeter catodon]
MSAGEVERLVSELSGGTGGDEEEEWLYGDENEVERPEEENASANPPSGIEDETPENGVPKPKVTETEDDSDSDSDDDEDDVHVTIGDIKTGAPQYGSYGTAPVNLNIKTGGRVYGTTGTKVKGVDLDAPGSINGVPLLEVDLDSFEDKPWRKPGADLSDYFNYGFNEDTWKAYCEKQKRIRMGLEVIPVTSTTNKITAEDCTMEVTPGAEIQDGRFNLFKVQQGRTGNSEKETALPSTKAEFTSPPSLFKTGLPPSRRLPGAIDVIGQTITISRVEGRRRANENSNIQVLSERSATEVDNNFSKPPPFFPPGAPPTHLPPPPFLPPPPTVSTAPPLIPPPGFPPPPGAPPPSLIPTIESGHSSGYDSRSARAFPYGNVAFPHLPGSAPSWPSLVDTSKQWDYYSRREKDRDRDRDRDRERDRDRDRERERTRERERERDHSPTPSVFNSDEERYRYREYAERGYERHRASREKEERHRERRHREKEETRHKSSRSNSRRRHESEEGDSHRRHKHKKSKRSKEGKEAGSEPAPEQESTEATPAE